MAAAKRAQGKVMQRGAETAISKTRCNKKHLAVKPSYLRGVQKTAICSNKLRAARTVLHVLNAGAFHGVTLRKTQ